MSTLAKIFAIDRLRFGIDGPGLTDLVCFCECPLNCRYCANKKQMNNLERIETLSPESLWERLKIDDVYHKAVPYIGGVTFGGGEPALQSKFIAEFRKICPPRWMIDIQTSLNVPIEHIKRLMNIIDTWYIDIKDINDEIYKKYTGKSNKQVLENLKFLVRNGLSDNLRLRVPLIPGFNTTKDTDRTVRYLEKDIGEVERFVYETLPNTVQGSHKYESLRGKDKCEMFMAIRKCICENNNIPYLENKCPKQNPKCKGTCPRCDHWLGELYKALELKEKAGEEINYSGARTIYRTYANKEHSDIDNFYDEDELLGEDRVLMGIIAPEPKESSLNINQFIEKYINFFERNYGSDWSKYQFFDTPEFSDDCIKLGFTMDCGHSFIDAFGERCFNDTKALNEVINRIDNSQLIGNALFSQWRHYHWAYSLTEANEDTKEWFLLLLRRLKTISEELKLG